MTVHFITGHLGAGKGLYAVKKIIDYMEAGRQVYTNIDIFPDKYFTNNKVVVHRIPDFPQYEDLISLPKICRAKDRNKFAALVLDEVSYFLNARGWNTPGRDSMVRCLKDIRKKGYDVYFIIQDVESLDSAAKRSLEEVIIQCTNISNFKVPVIGWLAKLFGIDLKMPRVHVATSWYRNMKIDTCVYSVDVKNCYDTDQLMGSGYINMPEGVVEMEGPYSILSAWHLKGRFKKQIDWMRLAWQWPHRWIPAVAGGCTIIPYVGCR